MATNLETKISRIQTAVDNALAAVGEKGVTVPDGSGVDALAGLIQAIESGGGVKIKCGSTTPAAATQSLTITHGLGVVPDLFMLFDKYNQIAGNQRVLSTMIYRYSETEVAKKTILKVSANQYNMNLVRYSGTDASAETLTTGTAPFYPHLYGADSQQIICGMNGSTNTSYYLHNATYAWLAARTGVVIQ